MCDGMEGGDSHASPTGMDTGQAHILETVQGVAMPII